MTRRLTMGEKPSWNTAGGRPGSETMDRVADSARAAKRRRKSAAAAAPAPTARPSAKRPRQEKAAPARGPLATGTRVPLRDSRR